MTNAQLIETVSPALAQLAPLVFSTGASILGELRRRFSEKVTQSTADAVERLIKRLITTSTGSSTSRSVATRLGGAGAGAAWDSPSPTGWCRPTTARSGSRTTAPAVGSPSSSP